MTDSLVRYTIQVINNFFIKNFKTLFLFLPPVCLSLSFFLPPLKVYSMILFATGFLKFFKFHNNKSDDCESMSTYKVI